MKLNGHLHMLPAPITAAELLKQEGFDLSRVAVLCNGEIVPLGQLEKTMIEDGDQLEVVSFVGGG